MPHLSPKAAAQGQTLLVQGMRRSIIALIIRHKPQIVQRGRDALFVSEFAPDGQALLGKHARRSVVIPMPRHVRADGQALLGQARAPSVQVIPMRRHPPEVVKCGSDAPLIAEFSPNGQALLEKGVRRSVVAEIISQMSGPVSAFARAVVRVSCPWPAAAIAAAAPAPRADGRASARTAHSAPASRSPISASPLSSAQRRAARRLSCSASSRSSQVACSGPAKAGSAASASAR